MVTCGTMRWRQQLGVVQGRAAGGRAGPGAAPLRSPMEAGGSWRRGGRWAGLPGEGALAGPCAPPLGQDLASLVSRGGGFVAEEGG